jgi:hypothetical protein
MTPSKSRRVTIQLDISDEAEPKALERSLDLLIADLLANHSKGAEVEPFPGVSYNFIAEESAS